MNISFPQNCSFIPPSVSQIDEAELEKQLSIDEQFVHGNNQFAFDLHQKISEERKGQNFFLCPFSVSTVLAMAYLGAMRDTASQMKEVLHFPGDAEKVAHLFETIAGNLRDEKLQINNGLFIRLDLELEEVFKKIIAEQFSAEADDTMDFMGAPEVAAKAINKWASESTQGRIDKVIDASDFDKKTLMVLANAVYTKVQWKKPFNEHYTQDREFTLSNGDKIEVPTMFQKKNYSFLSNDQANVLEIEFDEEENKNRNLALWIALPHSGLSLEDITHVFSPKSICEMNQQVRYLEEVNLTLPKIELKDHFSLNSILKNMGMKEAFSNTADFSKICTDFNESVKIGDVCQDTFLKWDEKGAEAAAVTTLISMFATSISLPPKNFDVDRPFAFAIVDRISGSLLFSGQVENPQK